MLLSYIKRRWKTIAAMAIFAAMFAMEAVLYASLLCVAVGALLLAASYASYRRRVKTLELLRRTICVSADGLPEPRDLTEELYQELVRILSRERAVLESAADYYAMWAHQIKTPIAAMHLLLHQEQPDKDALTAELFRIEQYVEMVLSYQKLEGDSSDFVLKKRPLDEIVRGCIRKYARLFIIKKLPLNFRETGMTVYTDEKWLAFMMEQILANALKYTSKGEISIYAEGKALVIEDTGIGISPEDLPRLGERGFTGYNGREDKKSTGLGLYLCKNICAKLGHKLIIESTPNVGTRVKLLFADSTMLYD